MQQGAIQATFYVLYATVSFVGILGNVLVLYVILSRPTMRHTVQNVFIANLSTSHVLLSVFAPFTLMYTLMGEWVFGRITCFFVACAQGVGFYVSSLTLMCIAVHRFMVLLYPCRRRPTPGGAVLIIAGIWVFSILATLPYGISLDHLHDNSGRYFCEEVWPDELSLRLFGAFSVLVQFVAPFIVIIYCYVKISFATTQGHGSNPEMAALKPGSQIAIISNKNQCSLERWQTNRMLIIMATIAGYSLLPLKVINIVTDIHPRYFDWPYAYFFFFLAHALATSSLCCNPILYSRFNAEFQNAFLETCPCCCCFGAPLLDRQPLNLSSATNTPRPSDATEIRLSETNNDRLNDLMNPHKLESDCVCLD